MTEADRADERRAGTAVYPLVLTELAQLRCVVVGGGAVAERKVGELLEGGAHPHVISPTLSAALAGWHDAGRLSHSARVYRAGDLRGAFLAIAATDDPAVNAAVSAEGRRLGILVNRADAPADGNFHTVAALRRGDLLLTASTGGASPALAARIRRDLAAGYGEEYGLLLDLLRELREGPARALPPARRAELWEQLADPRVLGWLRTGQLTRAADYAHALIQGLGVGG